jgi:drug/metabolite transporter (DMT)-like permease
MEYLGQIIAIAVAVSWTVTALSFEFAGKRIGSLSVNVWRVVVGFVLLGGLLLFTTGSFMPAHADGNTWLWMSLSGAVGFVFGDFCLFYSYLLITARFSQLLMTLAPPFAALFGWMMLGESLTLMAVVGMLVTLLGIAISILKRDTSRGESDALVAGTSNMAVVVAGPDTKKRKTGLTVQLPLKGILLGIGGALGQGLGIVLSKKGMVFYEAAAEGTPVFDYIPFAATQMRVIAGIVGFVIIIALSGRAKAATKALKDNKAMWAVLAGSIFGPFLGVSLSLMAVQHTNTAVASTIMATTPILILLPYILLYKKRVTKAEVIGAIISVVGVSLFFL